MSRFAVPLRGQLGHPVLAGGEGPLSPCGGGCAGGCRRRRAPPSPAGEGRWRRSRSPAPAGSPGRSARGTLGRLTPTRNRGVRACTSGIRRASEEHPPVIPGTVPSSGADDAVPRSPMTCTWSWVMPEASAMPCYRDLLDRAYTLGRADALFALDLEPVDGPDPSGRCCQGRDPAGFARHLWGTGAGRPPAGLEVNAPLCYAQGFREALAAAPAAAPAGVPAAAPAGVRTQRAPGPRAVADAEGGGSAAWTAVPE